MTGSSVAILCIPVVENNADNWTERLDKEYAQVTPPLLLVKPDIASISLRIAVFSRLHAKKICAPVEEVEILPTTMPLSCSPATLPSKSKTCGTPNEIINQNVLTLPPVSSPPVYTHKYLTSLTLLQKQVLVKISPSSLLSARLLMVLISSLTLIVTSSLYLSSPYCLNVDFSGMQSLSLHPTHANQAEPNLQINPYTLPTLKAIKKFQWDVDIAEACRQKKPPCTVKATFTDVVKDAAIMLGCLVIWQKKDGKK
ncbi:hypothetical protein BDQ12DRAFT_727438 [Crucibulum laeve]|uniref:Uncharacterized protein n=1 Tax=Crucibulum laeve TaxID=68775 RepID=A0A5C3LL45_9AGAR|nr:hypothetical protein BDQ12DRAFT_727438 [Crucibulum laeve]